MIHKHSFEYINLHLTNEQWNDLYKLEDHDDYPDIQGRGDCVRIGFKVEEQSKRVSANNPRVGTLKKER